jgi:hypothetical protein
MEFLLAWRRASGFKFHIFEFSHVLEMPKAIIYNLWHFDFCLMQLYQFSILYLDAVFLYPGVFQKIKVPLLVADMRSIAPSLLRSIAVIWDPAPERL